MQVVLSFDLTRYAHKIILAFQAISAGSASFPNETNPKEDLAERRPRAEGEQVWTLVMVLVVKRIFGAEMWV